MKPVTIFTGSTGLNTLIDPVRLQTKSNGIQPLAEAVNVDVCGETGRVSRRTGVTKIADVSGPHSLWSVRDESICLYISGTTLYSLNLDGTADVIKTGLSGDAASYTEAGSEIFFSDGTNLGRIGFNSLAWVDWEGEATQSGHSTTREFSGPPVGKPICFHAGRMVVAVTLQQQTFLMLSEPFFYNRFDLTRSWIPVPGDSPSLVASVQDGIFVSTSKGVFYISGTVLSEMALKQVSRYQVVPGTNALVAAHALGFEGNGDHVICVLNHIGACGLHPGGGLTPMTEKDVALDPASKGHGLINKADNYRYLMYTET